MLSRKSILGRRFYENILHYKRLFHFTCKGDMASLAEVSVCSVFPACIASREGGPTPGISVKS